MAVGLDPTTGIYTYADGSTYQNPYNYGTAANPQWSLNNAQINSILGDQGAAINQANGWDATPSWQTSSPAPAPAPASGGGATFGGGTTTGTTGNNSYGGASGGGQIGAAPAPSPAPAASPGLLGSAMAVFGPTEPPSWNKPMSAAYQQEPSFTPMPKQPATQQVTGGRTDYLYEYPDGTRGSSPFQRDANGNVITNAAGGVTEGRFLGTVRPDGTVSQSPIAPLPDGRVHLYGGYFTDAATYGSQPQNTGPAVFGGSGGSSGGGSGGGPVFGGGSGQQGAVTNRSVDAGTETIEGRIRNLLATDANGNYTNPLIQQAASSAMQQFAGRGLLNSSMANEAAMQAAMSKAIEIAGPDAQTYFAQGRANQDAANVFERDARGYSQENARLDKQLNFDMQKFDRDLQYRYDALKIDQSSQTEARALAQKYAIEMENIKTVNSAYDIYLRRISDIDANPDYSAETKIKMKNEAGRDFDLYAKAKGISWEMGLGGRFESPEPKPNAKPEPEVSGPSGSGMIYEGGG